jgi:hypothetical protein
MEGYICIILIGQQKLKNDNIHLLHAGEGNMKIYLPNIIIFPEGNA